MNEADKLWNEIKGLKIEIFSLPRQKVENHVVPLKGTPDKLFLKLKSPAVLPALEQTLSLKKSVKKQKVYSNPHHEPEILDVAHPMYDLQENEGYVIISRHLPVEERKEFQKAELLTPKREQTASQSEYVVVSELQEEASKEEVDKKTRRSTKSSSDKK